MAKSFPPRLHANVWILSAVSYLTDVSSEMMVNLLPLFLSSVLGAQTTVIGLIEGLAETTASLAKIASGVWSDRLGRRKWLAVAGYGLSTLAKPFLYVASTWGWVLGVRFADRLGKGIRTAPRDALLAGSVEQGTRGLAFGLHRAADSAGAFTGIGIAAWIVWQAQASAASLERETFQTLVLASLLPAAAAVLLLAVAAREVRAPSPDSETKVQPASLRQLDRRFLRLLLVVVIFTLGNSSDAFIILRASERGLSVLQILGMLLTFNAIYTLLSTPAGALSDRFGRAPVILTGWGLYAVVYLGMALAGSGGQVWLWYALYGAYYALTEGAAKALVADFIPQAQRGAAYGLYNAAIGLSALPASLAAGVLWQGLGAWPGFGPSAPFFFGAGMALIASILLFMLLHPLRTKTTA